VFPHAEIVKNRVNSYPVKVIVTAHVGATNVDVWSGRQQSLFQKNASQRKASISEIKKRLEDLKEDFE
jgi:hypothetical protein